MYDYLAKVILLGPSGCGKYVGYLSRVKHWTDCCQVVSTASLPEE
jgi:hypothetical protein